jgi:hypothetical protein
MMLNGMIHEKPMPLLSFRRVQRGAISREFQNTPQKQSAESALVEMAGKLTQPFE